jgi:NAD(P)-dependent dehydrogenase (short-subunit alcohol dehydrogenase family)
VEELRFDRQVAIVTGAGGQPSLGRSYSQLLAARGARVVVNDLGVGPDGRGIQRANAEAVAQEILDAGGEAIADTNSVAEEDTAKAVVQAALDAWGRVDILINNAGIFAMSPFEEMSRKDVQGQIDAHLMGTIWMSRAAWPHMKAAGYGRIVNITSAAVFGFALMGIYGAAKAGCLGLTRCLAPEGAPYGIKVNALGPSAHTAAATLFAADPEHTVPGNRATVDAPDLAERRTPDLVAPVAAFLAHEGCPFSGKYIDSNSGKVMEVFLGLTKGYENSQLTLEDVAQNIDQALDRDEFDPVADGYMTAEEIGPRFKPYTPA